MEDVHAISDTEGGKLVEKVNEGYGVGEETYYGINR